MPRDGKTDAWNRRLVGIETALNTAAMDLAVLTAEMLDQFKGASVDFDVPLPLRDGDEIGIIVSRRLFVDREDGRILVEDVDGVSTDWTGFDIGLRFDMAATLHERILADSIYRDLSGGDGPH